MAVRTMMRVTNPAEGMGAAPMLAAVAVILEERKGERSIMANGHQEVRKR